MYTLQELVQLHQAAKDAYLASLKATQYQVGSGGAHRQLQRANPVELKKQMDAWAQALRNHPDYTTQGRRRGIRYARPVC